MQQKGKIPILNQRGEFKTWHFTSVLTQTHEIHAVINWPTTNKIIEVDAQNLLVKACIEAKVMNEARPAWVTFISWRFSHVDAKLWISNTTAKLPLQDLPFEGYIQSNHTIDLPHLQKPGTDVFFHQGSGTASQATPRGRHRIRAAVGFELAI
jgi:hypothetical protein